MLFFIPKDRVTVVVRDGLGLYHRLEMRKMPHVRARLLVREYGFSPHDVVAVFDSRSLVKYRVDDVRVLQWVTDSHVYAALTPYLLRVVVERYMGPVRGMRGVDVFMAKYALLMEQGIDCFNNPDLCETMFPTH